MNIFEQYGIKEVADVTLYSIHKKQDGSGDIYYVPALYLDTLKISSTEKTADNVWAEGGYGNARLISWDYGKRINVSLTDALCTPASLGLCWGGILGADWKDSHINIDAEVCNRCNPVEKISRIEKGFYPGNDRNKSYVSNLLPRLSGDNMDEDLGILKTSSVIDGTVVEGFGRIKQHSYKWKLVIESVAASIAQIPYKFYDVNGKSYPIDVNRKVSVHSLPTYENYKDAIIYKINSKSIQEPPLPKIIYDKAMEDKGRARRLILPNITNDGKTYHTFAQLIKNTQAQGIPSTDPYKEEDQGAKFYITVQGLIKREKGSGANIEKTFYYPLTNLTTSKSSTGAQQIFSIYELGEDYADMIIDANIPDADYDNYGEVSEVISYFSNHAATGNIFDEVNGSVIPPTEYLNICEADYLAIIVDNNDNYFAYLGKATNPSTTATWYLPTVDIDVSQFKGLDMWLRFNSLNEMIYFLITKYNEDIISIDPATISHVDPPYTGWTVDGKDDRTYKSSSHAEVAVNTDSESIAAKGKLWAYVDPKTMRPYPDDYWFHQGEPYLVKSLTLAEGKKLKANKITVKADQWPGMYMMVGETWIRNKIGEDERMQIKIPFCKVKSDHTLSLEAGGDPVVFNLDLEAAKPPIGNIMEITTYEVATKMMKGENGCFYAVDGSTEVLSE